MPMNNEQQLESYKARLAEIEKQMAALRREHQGVATIVQGLELLTGKGLTQPVITFQIPRSQVSKHPLAEPPYADMVVVAGSDTQQKNTTIGLAIQAMKTLKSHKPLGAMALLRLILKTHGIKVNYQTLFKGLNRDVAKEDGAVYKKGGRFGLREWKK